MPGLSLFYSTANRPEMASPYPFLHFHCNLCGLCDRLLTETGSVKKRTSTLGVAQPACLSLNGTLAGTFPQWGFFKRACAAVPAKGSTVGQLPIELQPLLCGGVGQIRPHNCLPSQTGTAASLHPPKPATDCCSFGEPSVRNKQARWSNDCSTVLPLSLLGVIWMAT